MKKYTASLLLVAVLLSGCELCILRDCDDDDKKTCKGCLDPDPPDSQGNIVVSNNSNQRLVLYRGEEKLKIIPDDFSDYLVDVPNPDGFSVDLRIYKLDDVQDQIESPDPGKLFKRWIVVLAQDTELEHRSTWVIPEERGEIDSGTLTFSYLGGTENQIDVYLNSRNGAKIVSLKPGDQKKQVGVDYGNYTVLYRYWYSDPNTAEGIDYLGWRETEIVNGQEVNIFVVLNASRTKRHLQIPHWAGGGAVQAEYASIEIKNSTSSPVQIWVGAQLIEDIMYMDGYRQNSSTIAANESMAFILPVGEHVFIAKDLSTGAEISQTTLTIEVDKTAFWEITN